MREVRRRSGLTTLHFIQKLHGNGKETRLDFGFDNLRVVGSANCRIWDIGKCVVIRSC